mgnify:CR=1 FL=1
MKVIIVSPEKVLYQGEASSVVVPGEKGRFEILDHKTDYLDFDERHSCLPRKCSCDTRCARRIRRRSLQ